MSGPGITPQLAVEVNERVVRRFGGLVGVRDMGLLDSALHQPYQSYAGTELYPDPIQKACRLAYGVIENHPFLDGNKRTGAALLKVALYDSGVRFKPRHDELLAIVMGVASGDVSFEALVGWVREVARGQ